MKRLFIVLFICCFLFGCSTNSMTNDIKSIMDKNEYIIVDVRTKEEYQESHIVGAINIPYDEIDNSLDKSKTIFVYCKSGKRSSIAYNNLISMGYTVYDLGAFDNIQLNKE